MRDKEKGGTLRRKEVKERRKAYEKMVGPSEDKEKHYVGRRSKREGRPTRRWSGRVRDKEKRGTLRRKESEERRKAYEKMVGPSER